MMVSDTAEDGGSARLSQQQVRWSYLEVIGEIVLAAARAAKQALLVLGGAALGLVRRGRLRVVDIGVLLRSRRVLDVGRHGC
jgi:hypothetical protein